MGIAYPMHTTEIPILTSDDIAICMLHEYNENT